MSVNLVTGSDTPHGLMCKITDGRAFAFFMACEMNRNWFIHEFTFKKYIVSCNFNLRLLVWIITVPYFYGLKNIF